MSKAKKITAVIAALAVSAALIAGVTVAVLRYGYYYSYKQLEKQAVTITNGNAAGEITVMSANVRYINNGDTGKKSWYYRADLVMKNISSVSPDIICFQEVMAEHYGYLTARLPQYDSIITYRDDSDNPESCPVFYNSEKFNLIDKGSFWLSETPEEMSISWGAGCYRVCSYVILEVKENGKQFVVFNTHLDNASEQARINGIDVVLGKISQFGNLPSILTGDLNDSEDSLTYEKAVENFDDVKYRVENPEISCTYQDFGKELNNPCIDYIMISKEGFEVESYDVVTATYDGVYPSDHFPISAKLVLGGE